MQRGELLSETLLTPERPKKEDHPSQPPAWEGGSGGRWAKMGLQEEYCLSLSLQGQGWVGVEA